MGQKGLTLVELLLGTALLVGGGGTLLLGMQYAMIHAEYLNQFHVAIEAAQGKLEELSAASFETLWTGAGSVARVPLADLPSGSLAITIQSADLRNPLDPSLLDVHVAACWEHRGHRIGEGDCEDTDTDGNGWVDSPAMVSTRVAREN